MANVRTAQITRRSASAGKYSRYLNVEQPAVPPVRGTKKIWNENIFGKQCAVGCDGLRNPGAIEVSAGRRCEFCCLQTILHLSPAVTKCHKVSHRHTRSCGRENNLTNKTSINMSTLIFMGTNPKLIISDIEMQNQYFTFCVISLSRPSVLWVWMRQKSKLKIYWKKLTNFLSISSPLLFP